MDTLTLSQADTHRLGSNRVSISWHYLKSTLPVFAISALWQYAEAR